MKPFALDTDYKGNIIPGAITVSDHYDLVVLPAGENVFYPRPEGSNIFIFESPDIFWASFKADVPATLPGPVSKTGGTASVPNPYVRKLPPSCTGINFISDVDAWVSVAVFS